MKFLLSPHGAPGRIVDAILAGRLTVLYDDRILSEYRDVLVRSTFGFHQGDVDTLVAFIQIAGEPLVADPLDVMLPDATDLPLLEVAAAGHADALVSGNGRHFKPKRGTHKVDVCTPAEFIARVG